MNRTLKTTTTCLLLSLFAAACGGSDPDTVGVGTADDSPAAAPIAVGLDRLPEPALRRVPAPVLDQDQMRRKTEVESFIASQYKGYRIVDTTQTYSGDIIDWIDPGTVPGSDAEPPPRPTAEEMALPPGVELQPTELDLHPELRGPAGTIPMTRPTFDNYVLGSTAAGSIEEYIEARAAPGQPYGQNRLYGGLVSYTGNKKVSGFANDFVGSIESGTFSIIEMATICRGANANTDMELVGAAVGRDRVVFGDSTPRLRVEFMTAGAKQGNYAGGWDGVVQGFVPVAGRPYGPNVTLAGPVIDGAQYESKLDVQLFNGNWWVAHNGNWLGYYPGALFNLINSVGCTAGWYGEVYDPSPTDWTWSNMGSGAFAGAGYRRAAYVRNPALTDAFGTSRWPDISFAMPPADLACYSSTRLFAAASPWDRYFYLGGPGGDAAGCN